MDHSAGMGKKGIKRLLFQFSLPSLIVLTVNSVFGILDKIIIGRGIGEKGLSAFAASMPVIMITIAFGGMVSNGGATLISTRLGRGKKERAEQVMCNSIMIVTIVSLIISVLSIMFMDGILNILLPHNSLKQQAKGFLVIMMLGCVFRNVSMSLSDFIRAEGNPKYPMAIGIVSSTLSLIVSFILICCCSFGIEASAIAILISHIVSFILGIKYFFSGKSVLRIRIKDFKINARVIKNIFKIGIPFFVSRILGSITTILLNRQLVIYAGNRGIAALSIISSVSFLMAMPIVSISQGVEPILGYNYGSKQFSRVKRTLALGAMVSSAIAVVFYVISIKNAEGLIALFNNSKNELNTVTYQGLNIILITMPIMGIQMMAGNYFQSTGKYKQSLVLTLFRSACFLTALSILPGCFGLKGVWFTFVVEDLSYFTLVSLLLYFDLKKLPKKG